LSAQEARVLDERLQAAATSHLATALVLSEAGLVDEAQQALVALRDENPDSIEVQRLLNQLRKRTSTGAH
jgi:hypothetical protein